MDKVCFDFSRTEYLHICEEAMLSDTDRKILECKIKGLSYVQTGDICNMSADNVKKRMAKIKKRIIKVI